MQRTLQAICLAIVSAVLLIAPLWSTVYCQSPTVSELTTSSVGTQSPLGETCRWVGTAPFCQMGCEAGENQSQKDACGDGACCWTGWKYRCCKPIIQPIIVHQTPQPPTVARSGIVQ